VKWTGTVDALCCCSFGHRQWLLITIWRGALSVARKVIRSKRPVHFTGAWMHCFRRMLLGLSGREMPCRTCAPARKFERRVRNGSESLSQLMRKTGSNVIENVAVHNSRG